MAIADKKNQPSMQIDYSRQYKQGEVFRSQAFIVGMRTMTQTQNDSSRIEGLRQGRMQCFSTCFAAWAVMQEIVPKDGVRSLIDRVDGSLGNHGGGVFGYCDLAIEQLPMETIQREEIRTNTRKTSVSAEWNSMAEVERGQREANLLLSGGALILQNGNHYRLAFVDSSSRLVIFDPLSGSVTPLPADKLYDYAKPEAIGETEAVIIELPRIDVDDDFVMH